MRVGQSSFHTFALAVALALPARAEGAPARTASLTWEGPGASNGCLGAAGLIEAVEDAIGRSVFSPAGGEVSLVVSVEKRDGAGFRAHVRVKNERGTVVGERELVSETESCSSLDEPLVFAVTLMVDTQLAERARRPDPEPSKKPVPPRQRTVGGPSHAWLELDASVVVALGSLPEPSVGLDVGGELLPWRWFGVRAHASGFVPRARSAGAGAEARFGLYEGGLSLCPRARFARARLASCVGVEGGLLHVSSHGFMAGEAGVRAFYGFAGALRGAYAVSDSSSLTASAMAVLPQKRERFTYGAGNERRQLFEMARACVFLGAGAAVEF